MRSMLPQGDKPYCAVFRQFVAVCNGTKSRARAVTSGGRGEKDGADATKTGARRGLEFVRAGAK